jgi:hypothetical protein
LERYALILIFMILDLVFKNQKKQLRESPLLMN